MFDVDDDDRLVCSLPVGERPAINQPRWDQCTYAGRVRHFFATTNPFHLLHSSTHLNYVKQIIENYQLVVLFCYFSHFDFRTVSGLYSMQVLHPIGLDWM